MPLYLSLNDGEREVDYPGYERAQLTELDFTFGYGKASNCCEIRFPKCTDEFTGRATHFVTHRNPEGDGDECGFGQLDKPLEIRRDVIPNFAPNAIRYTVDPSEMTVFIQHLKEEKDIPCPKK